MKTFILAMTTVLFLLFFTNGIQAQTTQPKLNQLKLAEDSWVGTAQHTINKDTMQVFEGKQYGKVFVNNLYSVVKGEKTLQFIYNFVYSSEEDKFYVFLVCTDGCYETWIGKFTNEKKCSFDIVQNLNPEKIQGKVEVLYDLQKNMTAIFYDQNGTKTGEYKWLKVK